MRIQQSTRDGCTIITLTGRLDHAAAAHLQPLLVRRLRQQPLAVICDLTGIWALDPTCAGVFAAAAHHPASELVTNAVIHAHSQLRLLVELRSHQLHLAVHDADPHLLRLATAPEVLAEGGRRLPLVEALAASWQVQHPPEGGKAAACVLDLAH